MTQTKIFPKRFNASHGGHAPGHLRDALLDAIDAQFAGGGEWWDELEMFFYNERRQQRWDGAAPKERARWVLGQLWNSTDIVPGSICDAAGVPMGSSFASLVRQLVLDLR